MHLERIEKLINIISDGLYEREEIISNALLAVLAGQSVFLYGLPGTAKSLIARRLSKAFNSSNYFEYLMHRFSTPEEVFGPVSIHELKKDKFVRKTEGYLPTAEFAFLDEIWKSSPAILNTLLTIINERTFRNGDKIEDVPLKGLIVASNEIPPQNQGLEALYDRLAMRIIVEPMQERSNFEALIDSKPLESDIEVNESLAFSQEELKELEKKISEVRFSKEAKDIIHAIRVEIDNYNKKNPDDIIYISDRRWQKNSIILKTAAFLCDREEVIPVDIFILNNCLWNLEDNFITIKYIVNSSIQSFGMIDTKNLAIWIADYKDIKNEINYTFFHNDNIYETEIVDNKECIPVKIEIYGDRYRRQIVKLNLFAPLYYANSSDNFHLIDQKGKEEPKIKCNFKSGNIIEISVDSGTIKEGWRSGYSNNKFQKFTDFEPKIKFRKGTLKHVTSRVIKTFSNECATLTKDIAELINDAKTYHKLQNKKNKTPFVNKSDRATVTSSIQHHIEEMENNKLNAEHLQKQLEDYAATK